MTAEPNLTPSHSCECYLRILTDGMFVHCSAALRALVHSYFEVEELKLLVPYNTRG